jgi:hypothetical protein
VAPFRPLVGVHFEIYAVLPPTYRNTHSVVTSPLKWLYTPYLFTDRNSTIIGTMSHITNTFWFSHALSTLLFSRSKCQRNMVKINRISAHPSARPRQSRGPYEKGKNALMLWGCSSTPPSSGRSQRSGIKESGCAKFCADRNVDHGGIPTET